ncbi:MAG: hypothetical protein K6L60_05420 [Oceanobacter sp.]
MSIDLKAFCNTDDSRELCRAPISFCGSVLATNGWAIAFSESKDGYEVSDYQPSGRLRNQLLDIMDGTGKRKDWLPIGDITWPEKRFCPDCDGTGMMDDGCQCEFCNGEGKRWIAGRDIVVVHGIPIQANLMKLITDAPELKVAPASDHQKLHFKSGGTSGQIMAMNIGPEEIQSFLKKQQSEALNPLFGIGCAAWDFPCPSLEIARQMALAMNASNEFTNRHCLDVLGNYYHCLPPVHVVDWSDDPAGHAMRLDEWQTELEWLKTSKLELTICFINLGLDRHSEQLTEQQKQHASIVKTLLLEGL